LFFEAGFATGWTIHQGCITQFLQGLKAMAASFTLVFINRHAYTPVATAITISMTTK
jgi:hypothetical protein